MTKLYNQVALCDSNECVEVRIGLTEGGAKIDVEFWEITPGNSRETRTIYLDDPVSIRAFSIIFADHICNAKRGEEK